MKFVKTAAIFAAAVLAVQYLPNLVKSTSFVDAETANNEAQVVDAIITGYEGNADDPQSFRVITSSEPVSNAVSSASGLVHNSRFDNYAKLDGIDVSYYNGNINWSSVAADGIDFAIVRIGYRGYDGGLLVTDSQYYQNMQGAQNAGLNLGAYFFTQAITVQEAIDEAKLCIARVKDYNITMPIYFDVEETSAKNGRLNKSGLSIKQRTAIAEAFCQTIEEAGYEAGIYSSKNYFLNYLDPDYLATKYKIWLANYTTQTTYKGDYQMWQYSDTGSVKGISGNVDMNVLYSEKVNFVQDAVQITDSETTVKPELTGDGILTFESSVPSVATVDAVGNITGVSNGTAIVTVFSGNGSRDTITVNVDLPPLAVLNYSGMLLNQIGATEVISRSGVQLTSSDSSVAVVSADGTVSAVGRGTAEITADDGQGNTAVCSVLVTDSELLPGDCNLDGVVNAIDAVFILNLASALGTDADESQFSDSYMALYDFNHDGKVNSFDAADLLLSSAYSGVGYGS